MMFLGWQVSMKPKYEEHIGGEEGIRLKDLWREMEDKCFDRYLNDVNDDQRGVHVYQLLKHEVSQCKRELQHDNRREVMQECTQKIVTLSKQCSLVGKPSEG